MNCGVFAASETAQTASPQFMTGMFKVSNPSEARGNTVTAQEILDKALDGDRHRPKERPGTAGQNDVHHGGDI